MPWSARVAETLVSIRLTVNGETTTVDAHPMARLLDVLRDSLHLTGTKEGCGEGECGACSVLLNGKLVNSCLVPAIQADGAAIVTIEGLTETALTPECSGRPEHPEHSGTLSRVQQAFIEHGAAQCGICTPGMIMAVHSLLARHPKPTDDQIREALAGNLCRCTGYMRIFEAVRRAAEQIGSGVTGPGSGVNDSGVQGPVRGPGSAR